MLILFVSLILLLDFRKAPKQGRIHARHKSRGSGRGSKAQKPQPKKKGDIRTYRHTYGRTDTPSYRVASPRLKSLHSNQIDVQTLSTYLVEWGLTVDDYTFVPMLICQFTFEATGLVFFQTKSNILGKIVFFFLFLEPIWGHYWIRRF